MNEFVAAAERVARAGGAVLNDFFGRVSPQLKSRRNLVTEADLQSQRTIRGLLAEAYPDHQFLGEEDDPQSPGRKGGSSPFRWIVDPLDGTTNYVHGLPGFCVSVALERHGKFLAAAVFDPLSGDCYTAAEGGGARLNGRPVRVSDCAELEEALIAASFSAHVEPDSREVRQFVAMMQHCRALRRLGSAALNLCYVASGRLDAYWATSVSLWDVAAGFLLIREAGGVLSAPNGGPLSLAPPHFATAATPQLHRELVGVLNAAN